MVITMRYYYGTNDSFYEGHGRTATAKQIASIIKRDVEYGKWNVYNGGKEDSTTASCKYQATSFTHHRQLFIKGQEKEFKELENLIKDIIEVKPRQYN